MIVKTKELSPKKEMNPIIGVLLLLVAIILTVLTGPIGFIFGMLYAIVRKGFTGLGEYCFLVAKSIDQLGNVIMQHLFNSILIKQGGYKFGDPDETISSAIGKNSVIGKLSSFGKLLDKILDLLDKGHSINSIDYRIEYEREEETPLHQVEKAVEIKPLNDLAA